jgi:hypothetical protein
MMPARKDTREAGWPAVAAPVLATPPGRLGTSRPPHVIAAAAADPHEHDWAGPGFTKPGPESDPVRSVCETAVRSGWSFFIRSGRELAPGSRCPEKRGKLTVSDRSSQPAGRPLSAPGPRPRPWPGPMRRPRPG